MWMVIVGLPTYICQLARASLPACVLSAGLPACACEVPACRHVRARCRLAGMRVPGMHVHTRCRLAGMRVRSSCQLAGMHVLACRRAGVHVPAYRPAGMHEIAVFRCFVSTTGFVFGLRRTSLVQHVVNMLA